MYFQTRGIKAANLQANPVNGFKDLPTNGHVIVTVEKYVRWNLSELVWRYEEVFYYDFFLKVTDSLWLL